MPRLGQRLSAASAGTKIGQRYLVLATTRASTLQDELRLGSAAGYRVIAAWSTNEVVDGRAHQEEKAAAEDCAEALRNVLLELKRQ